jgi:hypothetical protein
VRVDKHLDNPSTHISIAGVFFEYTPAAHVRGLAHCVVCSFTLLIVLAIVALIARHFIAPKHISLAYSVFPRMEFFGVHVKIWQIVNMCKDIDLNNFFCSSDMVYAEELKKGSVNI